MRSVSLTAGKAGITRLREKGGASPETLYDLVNGYVTASRSIEARPGNRVLYSIPGTVGICVFAGKYVVFADHYVESPSPDVIVEILVHPTPGSTATLRKIHFAKPFLGYLYVVAEWSDNDQIAYHYWLQSWGAWTAQTNYLIGSVVQPTVPNGFAYVAERLESPAPKWRAGVVRAVNDRIEPNTYNGFAFVCIDTIGANPASGQTEPTWPAIAGATVIEETNGTPTTVTDDEDDDGDDGGGGDNPPIPPDTEARYNNMGGSRTNDRHRTELP